MCIRDRLDAQVVDAVLSDPQGLADINEQNCREILDSYQRIQAESQALHDCLTDPVLVEKQLNEVWQCLKSDLVSGENNEGISKTA